MAADGKITIDTRLNNAGFKAGSKELLDAIKSLERTAAATGKSMQNSAAGYGSAMRNSIRATREFNNELKQLERETAQMRKNLDYRGTTTGAKQFMEITDKVRRYEKALQAAQERSQAMQDKMGEKALDSKAFWESEKEIERLQHRIASLKKQRDALGVSDNDVLDFASQRKVLDQMEERLEDLRSVSEETGGGFRVLMRNAGHAAATIATIAGHGVLSFLARLAIGAKNAAIQLAKLAANAIRSGISRIGKLAGSAATGIARLGKAVLGLGRSSKRTGGDFKRSFKTILKYAFGVRSMFFLFRRLRTAVTQGLGAIAKTNPQLKASLDSLSKSFSALKGSLASAFAPIVTAVAPALVTLINLLTKAINTVGEFLAALFGQKFYARSVGTLDATGKSAKNASNNVKDLNRQLASFDQLDILKDKDTSSSGSTGYENTPISQVVDDYIDKIKELFAKGQFEEIGRIIANGLNKAIQKVQDWVSWENIGPTITKGINFITGAFNGLVDGFDWANLGKTVGAGINTLINSFQLLDKGIDWKNLGRKMAEGLNGLVNSLDFEGLGKTIADKITILPIIIGNALNNIDWNKLASRFADGINSFVSEFGTRITSVNWLEIARKMTNGLNTFIQSIDWAELGNTLYKLGATLVGVIKTAVTNFSWGNVGTKFANLLNNFFKKKQLWADAGTTITNSLKGILDFTKKFFITFDAKQAADDIKAALKNIKWGEIADSFWGAAKAAFGTFATFIKELFGEDNPAEKYFRKKPAGIKTESSFGTILSDLATTILNAIKKAFNSIPWAEWGEKIRQFLVDIKWSDVADALWDAIVSAATGVGKLIISALFGTGSGLYKMLFPDENEPTGTKTGTKSAGTTKTTDGSGFGKLLGLGAGAIAGRQVIKSISKKVAQFLGGGSGAAGAAAGAGGLLSRATKLLDGGLSNISSALIVSQELFEHRITRDDIDEIGKAAEEIKTTLKTEQKQSGETTGGHKVTDEELVATGVMLQKMGYSFEDIQKALNLNTEQLKQLEYQTRGVGAFGKLGDLLTGTNRDKTGTTDYQRAQWAANGGDLNAWDEAFNENTEALNNNTKVVKDPGDRFKFAIEGGDLKGWDEAFNNNTAALTDNTDATEKNRKAFEETGGDLKGWDDLYKTKENRTTFSLNGGDIKGWDNLFDDKNKSINVDALVNFLPQGVGGASFINKPLQFLQKLFAPGTDTQTRVELVKKIAGQTPATLFEASKVLSIFASLFKKDGKQTPATVFGTLITVLATLGKKDGKQSSGSLFGTLITVLASLGKKDGKQTSGGLFGTLITVLASLNKKDKTQNSGGLFGTLISVLATLGKKTPGTSSGSLFGTLIAVLATLGKKDSKYSSAALFGTLIAVLATLGKKNKGDNSGGLFGTLFTALATLGKKDNKQSSGSLFGTALTVLATLKENPLSEDITELFGDTWIDVMATVFGKNTLESVFGTKLNVTATVTQMSIKKGATSGIKLRMQAHDKNTWTVEPDALGGFITSGGIHHLFASGGMISSGGRASWWNSVNKYARGSSRAHGTMFVAGEAGPEIVGHVGGRTEVLNRSQLAQTMYSAVTAGMISALRGLTFTMPNVANGGLMPYEVSAQIAKSTADLQNTMDANNEDLIQTIISVAGQIVAAIQRGDSRQAAGTGGITAQQVINEINRQTLMYGASPLKGV